MHSFLLIGQSNMAGRGYLNEAPEIDTSRIYTLRNGRWMKMFRPINPDRSFSGTSLAESFAEAYSKKHGVDVGLICCADGGTKLEQWMPGVITDDEAEKQIASCRLPDDELPIITDNEKTAAGMIITRFEPGTTWCLNKVPYAERSYCGGRINKLYYSYLDGKVNLLEAIRMADVGLARNTSDEEISKVIDFMRYLEKYGYLAIENKIS